MPRLSLALALFSNFEREGASNFLLYKERLLPANREMTNKTRKMKNNTLAMEAAAATILKNPNIPAIKAMTRKIIDHFSMRIIFLSS